MIHALRSGKQVEKSKGFIKGKTLLDQHLTFWTMTIWNTEADMRAYRSADAHKKAMPKLQHWCDEASVVHWEQEDEAFPSWQHSYDKMRATGRISKVKYPSLQHANMDVPAPRYPSKTERILVPKN
jgi:heme-degrading monooxygenase HmoA